MLNQTELKIQQQKRSKFLNIRWELQYLPNILPEQIPQRYYLFDRIKGRHLKTIEKNTLGHQCLCQ